jgi:hypothetical protein
LRQIKHLHSFRAKLWRPNPDTSDAWEDLWKKLGEDTNAEEAHLSLKNDTGDLVVRQDNVVEQVVFMANATYAEWKASGTDDKGEQRTARSTTKSLAIQIEIGSKSQIIEGVKKAFSELAQRLYKP